MNVSIYIFYISHIICYVTIITKHCKLKELILFNLALNLLRRSARRILCPFALGFISWLPVLELEREKSVQETFWRLYACTAYGRRACSVYYWLRVFDVVGLRFSVPGTRVLCISGSSTVQI
jgi:hypothetical protein